MPDTNLIAICLNAFVAVMGILALLAGFLRLLLVVFPGGETAHPHASQHPAAADPAVSAAIQDAVGKLFPGSRASRIEPVD